MKSSFTSEQVGRIIDQALVYQCACPAQVCRTILELRELWDYQAQCLNQTDTDRAVHEAIARSTEVAHAEYERCLEALLVLEGWDRSTLTMPERMRRKTLKD